MSEQTAHLAVDRLFEAPAPHLTVEFQGGEPLLAFPMIQLLTRLIEDRAALEGKRVTFTMTTTLHHASDEILGFLRDHDFQVSTSLDGPSDVHDNNRPLPGASSYQRTRQAIERAKAVLGTERLSALTTLTRRSLQAPEPIIDEYVRLGFRSIFLRPLSPFGFAVRSARKLAYPTEEYLAFYERGLRYILELNRSGIQLEEAYAATLLRSILTPFPTTYSDLRSPVGAGFGTLVYNYDGSVYASDEGRMLHEMGNDSLRLGSVQQSYRELMSSDTMRMLAATGLAEALPGCSDCAFVPFCGPDPAGSISRSGDPVGHRANSEHCQRHIGLFNILFAHLAEARPEVLQTFTTWVHRSAPLRLAA
ncbi:His-Xaa-Ser system radical SAM maturase HxsB [Faunimonas pinastri]|uniref:His-Xaa-Ser system radical SAM maturase HxsB n=2 Tax=Faunimonas pinastri TaxID=1855383 RepID=A0A1H9QFV9_9HYPH|nr:His-Xaa-Ser system radical SAM maturase HxsB [Faunimonas pinastri]